MPTARINDVELYYETAGEGSAVLLIHGLGQACGIGNTRWEKWHDRIGSLLSMYGDTGVRAGLLARTAWLNSPKMRSHC